jgi:hypothetical protein
MIRIRLDKAGSNAIEGPVGFVERVPGWREVVPNEPNLHGTEQVDWNWT